MNSGLITVFGGSGFIGRYTVSALCKAGYRVRIAVRRPFLVGDLRLAGEVGHVQMVQANVRSKASIDAAMDGAVGVVNLVGVLAQKGRQTFEATQYIGARNIAQAAQDSGIEKLVHISAIGADADSLADYAKTKAQGEAAMRQILPQTVILRPSIVFGPEDGFFNRFAKMACMSPVLPLIGGGHTRFQPVHVRDVAACIVAALNTSDAAGKTYELGGPDIFSFRELLEFILYHIDRKRLLLPLPFAIAEMLGQILDLAFRLYPFGLPPLTGDQVQMLKYDNIVGASRETHYKREDLLSDPALSIVAHVPSYLWRYRAGGQYRQAPILGKRAPEPQE